MKVYRLLLQHFSGGQGVLHAGTNTFIDGAAYFPAVATVSLGGSIVLDVFEKENDSDAKDPSTKPRQWRILQEPNSLLVTTESAYVDTLHGIADVTEDIDLNASTIANWTLLGDPSAIENQQGKNVRTTRISLTYRDVKKVSTLGNKLFGKRAT
jgi:alkylated DNA repair protein alkB family protein 6